MRYNVVIRGSNYWVNKKIIRLSNKAQHSLLISDNTKVGGSPIVCFPKSDIRLLKSDFLLLKRDIHSLKKDIQGFS
jgi:hypothetical protein